MARHDTQFMRPPLAPVLPDILYQLEPKPLVVPKNVKLC